MGTKGEGGGGMNWQIGIDIYTLPCIKQVTNENLLYSTGNSTWCSVVTQMGRKSKKEEIYLDIRLIHFAVQKKLTQQCKATILQLKKKSPPQAMYSQPLCLLLCEPLEKVHQSIQCHHQKHSNCRGCFEPNIYKSPRMIALRTQQ